MSFVFLPFKVSKGKKCKVKHPDFLELCNLVPKEVINLRKSTINLVISIQLLLFHDII